MKDSFQIARLAEGDVRCKSDHLANFKQLVLANETMYPSISGWCNKKILPGIRDDERVAWVGYLNEKPAVSAVLRKGSNAKFCHLKLDESLRGSHLGEVFFSLMALEVRDFCKTIHFTLPESLWTEKGGFFQSFAFEKAECADVQYRLFDRELACSAKFLDVWSSVLGKIPKLASVYGIGGFSPDNQLLLTVRPKFADRIIAGKKTVELRRKFSTRWAGHQINLYASEPIASLVGEARISCVHRNHPEIIWQRFQHYVGCTKEEFDAYVSGAEEIYAIELDDVQAYRDRLPRGQMAHLLNEELTPPQSYLTLEKNKAWAKAVSLAAYLQGSFCQRFSRLLNIDKVENPFVIPTRAQPMKGIQTEFAI